MTIADLIYTLLGTIQAQWYRERIHEFMRDKLALTKALGRYGYACERNGWAFEPEYILRDILALLGRIKASKADVAYMPVYLEGAIDSHLRQRAEEHSEAAKRINSQVGKVLAGLPEAKDVREPTAVETLALVYRDLQSRKPKRHYKAKQKELAL